MSHWQIVDGSCLVYPLLVLEVLHYGLIDGALPSDAEIREELVPLGRWWHAACDSLKFRIPHTIF